MMPAVSDGEAEWTTVAKNGKKAKQTIDQSKRGGGQSPVPIAGSGGVSPKDSMVFPRVNLGVSSSPEWTKLIPDFLKDCRKLTDTEVMARLKVLVAATQNADFWLTDEGQKLLEQKDMQRRRPPTGGLSVFDYTPESKASLCPVGEGKEEWFEVELTADTGACDTVVPTTMCPSIPITPSAQSIRGMEYEVATGQSIPNLGEKKCQMWTEGASMPKSISMQVADVHKALLSLSRCADMGFENRFGAAYGCLIHTTTGEVIPLQRRGNVYILRAWIRAAPSAGFARQEGRP